jgi:hypothetical protein
MKNLFASISLLLIFTSNVFAVCSPPMVEKIDDWAEARSRIEDNFGFYKNTEFNDISPIERIIFFTYTEKSTNSWCSCELYFTCSSKKCTRDRDFEVENSRIRPWPWGCGLANND